jgi:hypothetical protein
MINARCPDPLKGLRCPLCGNKYVCGRGGAKDPKPQPTPQPSRGSEREGGGK